MSVLTLPFATSVYLSVLSFFFPAPPCFLPHQSYLLLLSYNFALGMRGEGLRRKKTHTVVCSHVHMNPSHTNRGGIEVEVDAPQRGTEGVGQARLALVVQGIGLAKDQRHTAARPVWPNLLVLGDVGVYRGLRYRVVQESALERDAG